MKPSLDREWEIWYAGPDALPWPTNIWQNEDNLRKAFAAGAEVMRASYLAACHPNFIGAGSDGKDDKCDLALADMVEKIRAL